jgi:hypothetical protein
MTNVLDEGKEEKNWACKRKDWGDLWDLRRVSEVDWRKGFINCLDSIVWTLLKSFFIPDLNCAKIPWSRSIRSVVSCMNTNLIITIEVLIEVLRNVNWNFIKSRVFIEFAIAIDLKWLLIWLSSKTEEHLRGLFAWFCEASIDCKMNKVVILALADVFNRSRIFSPSIKFRGERRFLNYWVLNCRELDLIWDGNWRRAYSITIQRKDQLVAANMLFTINIPCGNWIAQLNLACDILQCSLVIWQIGERNFNSFSFSERFAIGIKDLKFNSLVWIRYRNCLLLATSKTNSWNIW